MVDILKEFCDELQPFHEYWVHIFDKKIMSLVADLSSKIVHFGKLRSELSPLLLKKKQQSSSITKE